MNLKLAQLGEKTRTIVRVNDISFGDGLAIIAGPCSVESERQLMETAVAVKEAGAHMLRGGVFKPRTSPYSFQGLGLRGLKILDRARAVTGLPIITEVLDTRDVSWVSEYADVLQIGARNMQNFSLLKEAGKSSRAVLLKRGMYSTLDLSSVPAAKELTHLPVIVDPSHGTGRLSLIEPMSAAAVAAGADGLIVEVHINPTEALSDKDQALTPQQFSDLVRKVRGLKKFMQEGS